MTGELSSLSMEPVRFRGGAGRGLGRGTWPLGRCEFTNDYIEIDAPLQSGRATRDQVSRVLIRRRRFHAVALTLERADGTALAPTFYPVRTKPLIEALVHRAWPVEIQVFKPRVQPVVWMAVACAVIVGAGVEAVIQSGRADRMTRRSSAAIALITSTRNEGGRQRAVATYRVGRETFTTSLIVTWDKHPGNEIKLRYLPESPAHPWRQGDDPPGTSEWWLGPLSPLAAIVALSSNQLRQLRRRAGERPAGSVSR